MTPEMAVEVCQQNSSHEKMEGLCVECIKTLINAERQENLKIVAVVKMRVDMVGETVMGKKIEPLSASEALLKVIEGIQRRAFK